MKNMMFHGLANHGRDYFVIKLLSTEKGNLATLMKDKLSQPHIFNGIQWLISFSDVQDQFLKKQLLNRV
jgi:hypothetical protein